MRLFCEKELNKKINRLCTTMQDKVCKILENLESLESFG